MKSRLMMEVLVRSPLDISFPRCHKKTRRGKKRRSKGERDDEVREGPSMTAASRGCDCPSKKLCASPVRDSGGTEARRQELHPTATEDDPISSPPPLPSSNRPILRPVEVPKAPRNSTQFIIDDHEDCNLYLSFESPRKHQRRTTSYPEDTSGQLDSPNHKFATTPPNYGYWDIDYEYESPDDLDTTAFFERDFETIYKRAREDELLSMSYQDLVDRLLDLEERAANLEQRLSGKGEFKVMAYHQAALLQLQQENDTLLLSNKILSHSLGTSPDTSDDVIAETDLSNSVLS